MSTQPEQDCIVCEGNPKEPNNPCFHCGRERQSNEQIEPVAWMDAHQPWDLYKNKPQLDAVPLYTTPPQRKPLRNVVKVERTSDQSVKLVFTSCAAASEFENGIKE